MPDAVAPEEVKKKQEAVEEEPAEQPENPKTRQSGGMLQTVIFVAVTQVIMLLAAFMFVKFYLLPKIATGVQNEEPEVTAIKRGPAKVAMIEDLVVNPAGTNGTRYLSASIGLEYAAALTDKKEEKSSEGHGGAGVKEGGINSPIIRDILIAILTSKTIDQLSSAEGKENLRSEIMQKVNEEVYPDTVTKVYLVDYILQ